VHPLDGHPITIPTILDPETSSWSCGRNASSSSS
jgi:hypothetical protein